MQPHTHLSAAAYVLANLPADPSVYRSQPDEDFDRNLETIMTLEEAEGKNRGELLAGGTQAGDWDMTLVDEMHQPLGRKPINVREGFKITDTHGGSDAVCRAIGEHDDERDVHTPHAGLQEILNAAPPAAIRDQLVGRLPDELDEPIVADVNQRLDDSQKVGRVLRPMANQPQYEYQRIAEHLRFKPVELTMPTPKDVPITSSKQLFDDCPSVKDKWMRSPLELLGDHLQVLTDATRDDSYDTHELTEYAKVHCGDLLENLNARLRTGEKVDWDQADYLTGRGFPVTYDKATGVLCIAINNSAIFIGKIPKKKESVLG